MMSLSRQKRDELLVGLDIGTNKVSVVVGERNDEDSFDIVGIGSASSHGVTKGVITDLEKTARAIRQAVKEAEMMAGCHIREVVTNVSGRYITGENNRGAVSLRNQGVREADIERVLENAQAILLEQDREILHLLPRFFSVDDQHGIQKPLGLSGSRLEVETHLVTSSTSHLQNILSCLSMVGLTCTGIYYDGLASAEAVLTQDEREMGVVLVDVGAGTTDLVVVSNGSVVLTAVLPIGGDHISNDIALGLRAATQEAERIKISHGCAKANLVRLDETIHVPLQSGRRPESLNRRVLSDIIEPRLEELFHMIKETVIKSGMDRHLTFGIVLTGGTTHMPGICELAEEVTGLSVRRGNPHGLSGLADVVRSPIYSTSVGLLKLSLKDSMLAGHKLQKGGWWASSWKRARNWFSEYF